VGTYVCDSNFYSSNTLEIQRFYDEALGMWEYRWKNNGAVGSGTNGAWFGARNGALTCSQPGVEQTGTNGTDVSVTTDEADRVGQVFLDRAGGHLEGAGLPPGKDTFTRSRQ
jgi:hypothetical protein